MCSFDFTAGGPAELTARAGQSLRLAPRRLQPRVRGWVLASDGTSVGLLPTAYVKIRGAVPAGGVPTGPGVAAGSGVVPAAAAGGALGQPVSQPTAVPAPSPVKTSPVAAAGAEEKAGGAATVQVTQQACSAPTAAAPATEAKPGCCRSKAAATTAPVHAPAAISASTTAPSPNPASAPASASLATTPAAAPAAAPAPAPAPAPAETSCDRVAALVSQLPSNVSVVEVDSAAVPAVSLKAAGPSESASEAAQQ